MCGGHERRRQRERERDGQRSDELLLRMRALQYTRSTLAAWARAERSRGGGAGGGASFKMHERLTARADNSEGRGGVGLRREVSGNEKHLELLINVRLAAHPAHVLEARLFGNLLVHDLGLVAVQLLELLAGGQVRLVVLDLRQPSQVLMLLLLRLCARTRWCVVRGAWCVWVVSERRRCDRMLEWDILRFLGRSGTFLESVLLLLLSFHLPRVGRHAQHTSG